MLEQISCGMLIKQINDDLAKRANNSLRSIELTIAQLGALLLINQTPEKQMTLKELEFELHVAQSTVSGIMHRLEQKGFVQGIEDSTDRRIKIMKITSRGSQCCAAAETNMAQEEAMLLSGLNEEERSTFLELLQKVRSTLDS